MPKKEEKASASAQAMPVAITTKQFEKIIDVVEEVVREKIGETQTIYDDMILDMAETLATKLNLKDVIEAKLREVGLLSD
jgi:acetyl-CoA carboxylase alpha subunit